MPKKRRKKSTIRQAYDSRRRGRGHRGTRNDVFANSGTGHNSHNSKTRCTEWQFQAGRTRLERNNIFRFNSLIRRIITREPRDAVRPGFKLKSLNEEENRELAAFNKSRGFLNKLALAGSWARLHEGAAIYMSINDQFEPGARDPKTGKPMKIDKSLPVKRNDIRELGKLTVLTSWQLSAIEFEHDLDSGQFYTPVMYQLVENSENIHPSRLLIFQGLELESQAMFENRGWGGSVADAVLNSVMQYSTCKDFLLETVVRSSQGVLKMKDWNDTVTTENGEDAEARIDMLGEDMSTLGDVLLDAEDDYAVHARTLAGFGEAAEVFTDAMVAETDEPKSILMGKTPGGLNSGENAGDWKSWTSYLGGVQEEKYTPNTTAYLEIAVRARNSPLQNIPEDLEIAWGSLFELSELDKSTEFSTTSAALSGLVLNRVISEEEARTNPVLQSNVEIENLDDFDEDEDEDEGSSPPTESPEEQEEIVNGEGGSEESGLGEGEELRPGEHPSTRRDAVGNMSHEDIVRIAVGGLQSQTRKLRALNGG